MENAHGSSPTVQQDLGGGLPTIDVNNANDLIGALKPENAGRTIRVMHGTHQVGVPLLVPDGATLQGTGEMQFDDDLPVGFQGTKTRIIAKNTLKGNLLTLGNESKVEKLVLEGLPPGGGSGPDPEDADGRWGNVVAVASRDSNDIASATILDCELKNRIGSGFGTDGPTGGAVLVYTRNPRKPAPPDPLPHVDATVTVTVKRSIVDTPKDGKAVFAMNFASGGQITVNLENNVVRGPLDVIGGLSRPDAVVGATTTIESNKNRYSPQGVSAVEAWQIIGGSSSPLGGPANTDSNTASVRSKDDQIEKFRVGIAAVGGQRLPNGGTCSDNTVELELLRTTLDTKPAARAADFDFRGARSFVVSPAGVVSQAGEANTVHVLVRETRGSGPRGNQYDHGAGLGTGNQLVFAGTLAAFISSNRDIDPAPGPGFF
jgi:hypothetical protein